jgi:hypothetical protein
MISAVISILRIDDLTRTNNWTDEVTYTNLAKICAPRTPMILGIMSVVSIDDNNICNLMLQNCAPYDVTLECDGILGVMEIEHEKLIPLNDGFI